VQTAGAATAAMASVLEGLTVDPARMRANLEAARGVVFAERAVVLLTPTLGRDKAHLRPHLQQHPRRPPRPSLTTSTARSKYRQQPSAWLPSAPPLSS
jgi:hypothetical protein